MLPIEDVGDFLVMREKIGFSEAKEAFDEEKKDDPKRVKKVVYKDSSQSSQEEFQESYAWWHPNVTEVE